MNTVESRGQIFTATPYFNITLGEQLSEKLGVDESLVLKWMSNW